MCNKNIRRKALITGASGFIGYHVSKQLLKEGWSIIGIDSLSDYYDVSLKINRLERLKKFENFNFFHNKIESRNFLTDLFLNEEPEIIIHLAAQAGVRYSIENPRSYIESNILGTFELLEAARKHAPKHVLLASTSSTYGANKKMPYKETDKSDHQLSIYAATKKSTENLSHSYSHLFNMPITVFRFFTVYGPWGRPDMAVFKFTKAILNNEKLDIYNHGKLERDFTYIDDLVQGIRELINCIPDQDKNNLNVPNIDSKSPTAPFRIVNIGNSKPIKILDLIKAIEKKVGKKAQINFMPMQPGDIKKTWADTRLLNSLTNISAKTSIDCGINKFINWFRDYYNL